MSTSFLESGSALDERAKQRLASEQIVWITSVSPAGTPAPTPVWFGWNGTELIIASQPNTAKLRNIAAHPQLAVHFNADHGGGDVQVFNGTAVVDPGGWSGPERLAYDTKYAGGISGLGMTPESFHDEYSEVIRFTPTRMRGF